MSTIIILKIITVITLTHAYGANRNPCGYLYLTQTANKARNLELNWDFKCADPPDTILLTSGDFQTNASAVILYRISPGGILQGHHRTNQTLQTARYPGNWNEEDVNPLLRSHCLDYHIVSLKNNAVIYSQCLAIEPAWMENFGELRIGNMMIPGTHNSGAWHGAPPFIKNYALNQDGNFWKQLVFGIRFFDIRVGRYDKPASNGLYINHDFVKCTSLRPELQSVLNFVQKSPKEVIVLNFHRFPHPKDFTLEYHSEILDLLLSIMGKYIYPYPKYSHMDGPRLREFWQLDRRIIVSYANDGLVSVTPWLWPPLNREWGNVIDVKKFENFIKMKTAQHIRGNPMSVLMAELTPTYAYIISHLTKGLKDLANLVNPNLAHWLREYHRSDNVNIIATDFFTGNDIVNVAIETNFRKLNKLN